MEGTRAKTRRALGAAVLAVLTGLVSCSEATAPLDDEIVQGVLFHGGYTNFAWVATDVGLYVDREGNVWRMRSSVQWDLEVPFEGRQDTTSYPAPELEAMYEALADSIVAVVDPDELAEKFALIRKAAYGAFSPGERPGADQGVMVLGCLLYDPEVDTYRRVVLRVSGDWTIENLSPAAQELAAWLMGIWTQAI